MNWHLFGNLFASVFFFGPGILLLVRFLKGPRFPWWIVIVLALVVGWGCLIGVSLCTTKDLSMQIESYESRGEPVPDELMEDWASDAHAVFAVFFGWAFTVPVLCLWLIAYAIANGVRKVIRKKRRAHEPTGGPEGKVKEEN